MKFSLFRNEIHTTPVYILHAGERIGLQIFKL